MKIFPSKKTWIIFLSGAVAIFWLGAITSIATDSSNFCDSCHYMEPFVENWQNSNHSMVDCVDCHYGTGVSGFFKRKAALLGETLKYFAGTYSLNPRTKVVDEVCMDCHKDAIDTEEVYFMDNIPFNHKNHYH